MLQITDRIEAARKAKGLTVSRLAEDAVIPRVTFIRRLADPTTFTLAEIARVAAALDTTPLELTAEDVA